MTMFTNWRPRRVRRRDRAWPRSPGRIRFRADVRDHGPVRSRPRSPTAALIRCGHQPRRRRRQSVDLASRDRYRRSHARPSRARIGFVRGVRANDPRVYVLSNRRRCRYSRRLTIPFGEQRGYPPPVATTRPRRSPESVTGAAGDDLADAPGGKAAHDPAHGSKNGKNGITGSTDAEHGKTSPAKAVTRNKTATVSAKAKPAKARKPAKAKPAAPETPPTPGPTDPTAILHRAVDE